MSDQSLVSPVTPYVVSYPSSPLNRKGTYGALAVLMTFGAGLLIAYPWLTHRNSGRLQASAGGSTARFTIGHAVPPRVDPQLRIVGLGQQFALNQARVTIRAASVCRLGRHVLVNVPAAIRPIRAGETVGEPEYQLLDAHNVPYLPLGVVAQDARRGSSQHAAPPPSPYHESINFQLPVAAAQGALKLQAVLASGSGPEYRVTVADAAHQLSPSTDGGAACISPGGQGV